MNLTPEFVDAFCNKDFQKDIAGYQISHYLKPGDVIVLDTNPKYCVASIIVVHPDGTMNEWYNMSEMGYKKFLQFKYEYDGGKKFDRDMFSLLGEKNV